ncbi:FG-GAP-like repeat-containing protein [Hymenobacter bucti]|uniref:FG-GAP-like repeat-containing protein n=1 Tax=Hymenobacter bucti TaxID=1844114 RepID=A0ABW4QPM8_9BACT
MFCLPTSALLPAFRRLTLAGLGLLPLAASAQTILAVSRTQAAAGATVTITGTDLNKLTSAMINGQPMNIAKSSYSSVDVIVPVAAATGRIRLTSATGTALTGTKLGITRQSSAVSYGQVSTSVTGMNAAGSYSTPAMGDIDGDGLVELIQGQGDGTILVFEQTAAKAETFGAGTLLKNADGTTLDVGSFAKPTLADLDGDGLLELLVGEDTGNILRYEQTAATGTGALAFTKTTLFTNPFGAATASVPNGGSYPRPTVADLDNNGLLDVLVGSNDGTLRRYEQTAANAATFTALGQMKLANGTVIDAGDVDKPLLTDYNGDGYLDMLLGNRAGSIVLYTQSAANSATFQLVGNLTTNGTTAMSLSGVGGYAAPAITDLDGDGLLDLFVGNGNGTIQRFEQAQSATTPTLLAGALTNPAPLPVVLTSFTGQSLATGNVLRWTTASEANSDYFEVERSFSGQAFVKIGQLAAAGTTSAAHSYQFADDATAAGTSYYRLRQVDLDGTSTYSPIVTLAASSAAVARPAKPVAYPTVFTSELNVALPGAEAQAATVALLTADGRPVYSRTVQLGTAPQALAELPTLAPGVYLLRIATAAGATTQRVVRN